MNRLHRCPLLILAVLSAAVLLGAQAAASDADVPAMLAEIFDGEVSGEHGNVVFEDTTRKVFWAFHTAAYLDVIEVRVYMIPYASADPAAVRAMLAAGNEDEAFESLLSTMNLSLGAMFLADVGLNGIRDEGVPLGEGEMRDSFHREQFADHAEANKVYLEWLARAILVKERTR